VNSRLEQEIDAASLAVVRMVVALAAGWEVLRFVLADGIATRLQNAQFLFTYPLFGFVRPLPGLLPYAFFAALGLLVAAVLVGWQTRITSKLLAAGMLYWFLLDATAYSDHAYLLNLLLVLVAWLPVNRWMSSDCLMGREKRSSVPAWTLGLIRVQILLVYVHSGLSQLNGDWLRGAPLAEWLSLSAPGPVANLASGSPALAIGLAWLNVAFELSVGFLLWMPRTRRGALVAALLYHLLDAVWLHIGVSPVLMAAMSFAFCEPDWPRPVAERLRTFLGAVPGTAFLGNMLCTAGRVIDRGVSWFDDTPVFGGAAIPKEQAEAPRYILSEPVKYVVAAWLVVQIVVPLRQIVLPGPPEWTSFGSRFAWRGAKAEKQPRVELTLVQPDRQLSWVLDPLGEYPVPMELIADAAGLLSKNLDEGALRDLVGGTEDTLPLRIKGLGLEVAEADRLLRMYEDTDLLALAPEEYLAMLREPDLLRQYCERVRIVMSSLLGRPVMVRAATEMTLNHRPFAPLIGARTDLSAVESAFDLGPVILPLKEPLPPYAERVERARELIEERERERALALPTSGERRPPEPVKVPAFTDEDERWFEETYGTGK